MGRGWGEGELAGVSEWGTVELGDRFGVVDWIFFSL